MGEQERMRTASALPAAFIEWQREARASLVRRIASDGAGTVRTMPAHLAVVGTSSPDGTLNLATKGVGLVPRPERLEELTETFRDAVESCRGRPWPSTIEERGRTLLTVYSDALNFDDSKLGGLEIFEGATYENLRSDPRASLLFSGEAPVFPSYQVDCEVEIVEKGDPHYEYLLAARELFARDFFHVPQRDYPHGFVFHVKSVRDKRPFSRVGGHV